MRVLPRFIASLALFATMACSFASLTENWSRSFAPPVAGVTASQWRLGTVNPGDNSITLVGTGFSDTENFVFVQRLSSDGAVLWNAPILTGDVFLADVVLDQAGNVYACGAQNGLTFIISYDGATGAVRFSKTYGAGGYSSIAVKKVSSTTTVLYAAGANRVGQGQPVLTRANVATGALISEIVVPTIAKSAFRKITIDQNGNPIGVGLAVQAGGLKVAFAAKYSISLNQVWRQDFPEGVGLPGIVCDNVVLRPDGQVVTTVISGFLTAFPVLRSVRINSTSGAVIADETVSAAVRDARQGLLVLGADNLLARAFVGQNITGTDVSSLTQLLDANNNVLANVDVGLATLQGLAMDRSNQLLMALNFGSESQFAYGREPASALITIDSPGSFCLGVVVDSVDRVISLGQLNGQAFVRQDQQGIDANDDTYFGIFPSTLRVTSPGVFLNDAAHFGKVPVLVNPPTHGTVALDASGGFDYTATQFLPSDDSFTYKISDGGFTSFGVVNIRAVKLDTLNFATPSIKGGSKVNATLTLNSEAPADIVVTLAENSPALAAPSTATITKGAKSGGFVCDTFPVLTNTNAFLTATFQNVTLTKSIVVKSGTLTSVTLDKTDLIGGTISSEQDVIRGEATLNAISTTDETLPVTATGVLHAPSALSLPIGVKLRKFQVTADEVAATTPETLTVRQNFIQFTFTINVKPIPRLQFFSFKKPIIIGGVNASATATLTDKTAPQMSPMVLQVIETSASVQAPTTVSIPPGTDRVTFAIPTKAVAADTGISVKVKRDLITVTALLTLIPNSLDSVSVTPSTLQGGNSAQGEVKLNNLAPVGGFVIGLSSSSNALKVPASVKIQAGSWSGPFAVTTLGVAAPFTVTVTATLETKTRTAQVKLLP
ncbi:MAG: Ig-like domain-containing protein [Fimbriimonadaceae bacterium]